MRKYKKPVLNVEQFTANEFIAACHDQNTVYKFTCDAPRGPLYYYPQSDGKIDGTYNGKGRPQLIGSSFPGFTYHPCNKKHEASTTDDFYDGFVDRNYNGRYDAGEGVIVWRGADGKNGHATKNLDMTTWETSKS